jgi:hypothetical protein
MEAKQERTKLETGVIKDKIKSFETENRKFNKQIENIQSVCEETTDRELLKLSLIKETDLKRKLDINNNEVIGLRTEYQRLTEKSDNADLELTYYDVKQKVLNFFENMTVSEKRLAIISAIKSAKIFNREIVIESGGQLFIFDTKGDYRLPEKILEDFKNGENFKESFLNSNFLFDDTGKFPAYIQEFYDTPQAEKKMKYTAARIKEISDNAGRWRLLRKTGNIEIQEFVLADRDDLEAVVEILGDAGIECNLSEIEQVVIFKVS